MPDSSHRSFEFSENYIFLIYNRRLCFVVLFLVAVPLLSGDPNNPVRFLKIMSLYSFLWFKAGYAVTDLFGAFVSAVFFLFVHHFNLISI